MSKVTKINNKKPLAILFTSLGLITTAVAGIALVPTLVAGPVMIALEGLALGTCFGGLAGVLSASRMLIKNIQVKKARKTALKSLNKIKESTSVEERRKYAKKYAKANLKLCKLTGAPVLGTFHYISNLPNEKLTKAKNTVDALTILRDLETKPSKRNSLTRKINKKNRILEDYNLKTSKPDWTESISVDAVENINIYDRRNEISCLNPETQKEFARFVGSSPSSDSVGASCSIQFNGKTFSEQTYIRISDPNKLQDVKKMLIRDAVYAYEKSFGALQMFPCTVSWMSIKDKNLSIENNDGVKVNSIDELKLLLSRDKVSDSTRGF